MPEIAPDGVYELATNNYIAGGGSGYHMLRRNTTQQDSGIPQREAVIDFIRTGTPCMEPIACTTDAECGSAGICACNGMWSWDSGAGCMSLPGDGCMERHCVLEACVWDVALFYAGKSAEPGDDLDAEECSWRNWAAAECMTLPCIDDTNEAAEDGRIEIAQ